MISGIRVRELITHCDDRGWFREILRDDDNLLSRFGQLSATKTYPGVIKAFHWHRRQDDVWYVSSGNLRAVLHDLRADSPTVGESQQVFMGDDNPVSLFIPAGVAHGYQVLGNTPAMVIYCTTQCYEPKFPDEERIAFDDPMIGFDWSIANR